MLTEINETGQVLSQSMYIQYDGGARLLGGAVILEHNGPFGVTGFMGWRFSIGFPKLCF